MTSAQSLSSAAETFRSFLTKKGFQGDIGAAYADRLIAATDNSIYQQMPQLVVYPRSAEDLTLAVLAAQEAKLPLAPRGGGTGTNAQSLTQGVVVDVTRYMDKIGHFDPEKMTVRVQPGVILSRLNAFLKPYGFFFPPMVSTATRATIGGMVATDASGKGSRIYGKTSDYIDCLDVVLSDGSTFQARDFTPDETAALFKENTRAALACSEIYRVVTTQQNEIERIFPRMNRGLTGYNLKNIISSQGGFNPIKLLAGSEGTLAVTQEITLRVKKIPQHRSLIAIRYDNFNAALEHIQPLLKADPLAIEILDDHLLTTAREDISWKEIESVFDSDTSKPVRGINFVEFVGDDLEVLAQHIAKAQHIIEQSNTHILDYKIIEDEALISKLWDMRAKAVGLLGRLKGKKQGVPFVEDTAVPPEKLPAYTKEFRRILDDHQLEYAMFGHADVGCLHVRPFLNMRDKTDQQRIRTITDAVARLTHHYGVLLWGEHGRGVRGEFSPLFFGETLFNELCHIKAAFDPDDLFNRGKLVPVKDYHVDKIDGIPFRGALDAQISSHHQAHYASAINCNGNGACFNQEPSTIMCPSYKATKDRLQSPKGRAALLREWLRLSTSSQKDKKTYHALLSSVKKNLDTCLACKACHSQCPIRVDIPSLRARFLHEYYQWRLRPLKDYFVRYLESFLKIGRFFPKFSNLLLHNSLSARFLMWIGFVDLPHFSTASLPSSAYVTPQWINSKEPDKLVILQDSFVGSFDGKLIEDAFQVLTHLGFNVRVTPVLNNGKASYIKGFKKAFRRAAQKIFNQLTPLSQHNIPIIAVDAATMLMFEHEYCEEYPTHHINILSPEQFLLKNMTNQHVLNAPHKQQDPISFIPHCSSQSLAPQGAAMWETIMKRLGITLQKRTLGCCGMAGIFGHERQNYPLSEKIFNANWKEHLDKEALVEGFSCRCQIERMLKNKSLHPLQFLKQYYDL